MAEHDDIEQQDALRKKKQEEKAKKASGIQRVYKGMFTDSSYHDQPDGMASFVLNGVNETEDGDMNFVSNEQSNEIAGEIENGYTIVGRVYMTNNETAVFSVGGGINNEQFSEIGIYNDKTKTYVRHVNTELGFKKDFPIQATFRMRRGCERVIYFVTPKPMIYCFDTPDKFKKNGSFAKEKFNLFKTYKSIPEFQLIKVQETGSLWPGSYNFSIQYLDGDMNPTEWITVTDTIIIYNDSYQKPLAQIRGSTSEKNAYRNYGRTNKGIRIELGNLDEDFLYYRIAIIAANSGSGQISEVLYSKEYSIYNKTFVYDGSEAYEKGTLEEIQGFNNIIDSAENIAQLDNILVLGNTKNKQINFCELQKFASMIRSYMDSKEILLSNIQNPGCQKRGELHTDNMMGYMPGEIYSFGIVYVFSDGTTSPAYHIPGESGLQVDDIDPRFLMSTDNRIDDKYIQNNDCADDYWGTDHTGNPLKNQNIRHHRFPTRGEMNQRLHSRLMVWKDDSNSSSGGVSTLTEINLDVSFRVNFDQDTRNNRTPDPKITTVNIKFSYNSDIRGRIDKYIPFQITKYETIETYNYKELGEGNLGGFDVSVSSVAPSGSFNTVGAVTNLTKVVKTGVSKSDSSVLAFRSWIFGIRFGNIIIPPKEILGGQEITGYYIVRNERTEDTKTILDTGVLCPLLREQADINGKGFTFAAHGMLMPQMAASPVGRDANRIQKDTFALIHPEFKFNRKEYGNTAEFIIEAIFDRPVNKTRYAIRTEDASPGTTYNPSTDKDSEKDFDGWDLYSLIRNNSLQYTTLVPRLILNENNIKDKPFYLDALFYRTLKDQNNSRFDVYNLSSDNKIGIVQFKNTDGLSNFRYTDQNPTLPFETNDNEPGGDNATGDWPKLFFVIMKRKLANVYSNFRTLPYYKETLNYIKAETHLTVNIGNRRLPPGIPEIYRSKIKVTSTSADLGTGIYNGDTYISSMKYVSSMFFQILPRDRARESGFWRIVGGIFTAAAGVALFFIPGGQGFALPLLYAGITMTITGIKMEQATKVYKEEYERGLKNTVNDWDSNRLKINKHDDDDMRWVHDILNDLWFESGVNINWRMGNTAGMTDFMDSPLPDNQAETKQYMVDKMTTIDTQKNQGRTYQGIAKAEMYDINPDYRRREREKWFEHLGLEYTCCSECRETFPHRIAYSQQSFQEELTDNFRVFLPNNYKDIEGMTGAITNLFTMRNNLYMHTEEGLWHLPQHMQERVTQDIVSFIGTGSYFSVPPRRIVDDATGNSGGTNQKWATVKTPHGVFFVSEKQRTIYQFNGESLRNLNKGMDNWFNNNIPLQTIPGRINNAPNMPYGQGFLAVYDNRKERIIFTKKEYTGNDSAGYVNYSWTLGYSMKMDNWVSFYDYMPDVYFSAPTGFFSWKNYDRNIWKHNVPYKYQNFYGQNFKFIVEYVSVSNPLATRIWDGIKMISQAKVYNPSAGSFSELRNVTFNKAMFYNGRQCTGIVMLVPRSKNYDDAEYLSKELDNYANAITVNRNERDWEINQLRDIRENYELPMFKTNIADRQNIYFIDKILNETGLNINKDWTQMESFRDKFLVCRFIFDKFEFNDVANFNNNIKLILNYTLDNEYPSYR